MLSAQATSTTRIPHNTASKDQGPLRGTHDSGAGESVTGGGHPSDGGVGSSSAGGSLLFSASGVSVDQAPPPAGTVRPVWSFAL